MKKFDFHLHFNHDNGPDMDDYVGIMDAHDVAGGLVHAYPGDLWSEKPSSGQTDEAVAEQLRDDIDTIAILDADGSDDPQLLLQLLDLLIRQTPRSPRWTATFLPRTFRVLAPITDSSANTVQYRRMSIISPIVKARIPPRFPVRTVERLPFEAIRTCVNSGSMMVSRHSPGANHESTRAPW